MQSGRWSPPRCFLRFSIGFLIFTVCLPVQRWLSGLGIALLLTLPFAILTGSYSQFLISAALGGLVIGFLADRFAKPCYEKA
ncbi:MAG: hypothetical protein HC802_06340 [Caldilineaceae bacterium]|nr:hypothetical protein [Caldilineaceae bacterium]